MSAQDFVAIKFGVSSGVARITLNRPNAANALNLQMARELRQAATFCEERKEVRAVVLDALGARFCVGGDIKSFLDAGEQVESLLLEITDAVHDALVRFSRMDAPLITCVQGVAAGAGMGMALAGDLVYAVPRAIFVPAYAAAGLSPDCGLSWLLPRLVGHRRSQDILLNNRSMTAAEAASIGLITELVDPETFETTAFARAKALAEGPTGAYGTVKRLLTASASATFTEQLRAEAIGIARLATGADGQEGMRAFAEKRKANFRGN